MELDEKLQLEEKEMSALDFANFSYYNDSTNITDPGLYQPELSEVVVISLFYCAISLTAVVGNSTVILIVLTSRRMQSVTNFFIANLALADVIIGLFAIPFQFQAALLQRWNLPSFLCPFCPFFQNLSVNASIFTLTAIAVDRYKAIMYPLKSHASKSRTKGVIVVIWIVSTILAVPMVILYKVYDVNHDYENFPDFFNPHAPDLYQCLPYPQPTNATQTTVKFFQWYKNCLCLLQYFIPLVIISGAYIRMAVALWSSRTPGAAQLDRDRQMMNNKKKVIKMLMMVVALFTLAWLPLQLYDVLNQIFHQINEYPYINIIWFCMHWLAMSNSCYNPFIYLLLNDKFQKELRLKLACCFKHSQSNYVGEISTAATMVMRTGDTFRRRRLRGGQPVVTQVSSEFTQGETKVTKNNNVCFEAPPMVIHSNGLSASYDNGLSGSSRQEQIEEGRGEDYKVKIPEEEEEREEEKEATGLILENGVADL